MREVWSKVCSDLDKYTNTGKINNQCCFCVCLLVAPPSSSSEYKCIGLKHSGTCMLLLARAISMVWVLFIISEVQGLFMCGDSLMLNMSVQVITSSTPASELKITCTFSEESWQVVLLWYIKHVNEIIIIHINKDCIPSFSPKDLVSVDTEYSLTCGKNKIEMTLRKHSSEYAGSRFSCASTRPMEESFSNCVEPVHGGQCFRRCRDSFSYFVGFKSAFWRYQTNWQMIVQTLWFLFDGTMTQFVNNKMFKLVYHKLLGNCPDSFLIDYFEDILYKAWLNKI